MTADEKKSALQIAASHGLGARHVPITPARLALVTQFLDVNEQGEVVVVGGRVEAVGAHYAVVGVNGAPRTMFDVVKSGEGADPPYSIVKLIEDLSLVHGIDLPRR